MNGIAETGRSGERMAQNISHSHAKPIPSVEELVGMLAEIIDALSDADLRIVARHLFGLAGGRMATKQSRLEAAGRQISHSWETLRKRHAPELLAEMADQLAQMERLQRAWNAMERR